MQRQKNFGACTYVLLTLFTFALKMAVFNCDIGIEEYTQAKLTAVLTRAVRSNYNRIISPASIQDSLLVATLGAKNGSKTLKELQGASQVPGSKDVVAQRLKQISAAGNLHNYFFVNKRFQLNPEFRQWIKTIPLYVNFHESKSVAEQINRFVAIRTNGQLQKDDEIVKHGSIDEDTTVIALNLMSFAADWKTPFSANSESSKSNSMYTIGTFLYGKVEGLNATAAVLPFKGSNAFMLVIFADEKESLIPLENRLMQVDITKIPSVLKYRRTSLHLPSFRFQTVYSVSHGTLQKMQIKEAFTGQAELDDFGKTETVFLRYFNQFSSIKVDEHGVKFASATHAQYELSSAYQEPEIRQGVNYVEDNEGLNPYFYYIINGVNVLAAGSSYNGK